MKLFMLGLVSALAIGSSAASAKDHPLIEVAKEVGGHFSPRAVPKGYTATELHRRPKFKAPFLKYLAEQEAKNAKRFETFVMESEEWDHLSEKDRIDASKHATRELGVRYLIEIQEVYAIKKGDVLVGYVYTTSDHVEAHIIQDGAGLEIYVDLDGNVVTTTEWQA